MAAEGGDGVGGGGYENTRMSPKNRVKLLCSHGGKILPRPSDGVLKYVGGETRVVAFSRETKFSELTQKLTSLFDGDLVLKYQLIPQDLDALVSVKSDEDLRHMLDEYERQEGEGIPRLRAFLFPSNPILLDLHIISTDAHTLEQRYIDAINGVVRVPPPSPRIIPPTHSFTVSSAGSSPQSPSHDPTTNGHESPVLIPVPRALIHKVRSSPSLYSLSQQTADTRPHTPLPYQHQHHCHHQNYQQYYHYPAIQYTRPLPPQDLSKGAAAAGRAEGPGPSSYYSSQRQQYKGGGKRLDRADTIPQVIWE